MKSFLHRGAVILNLTGRAVNVDDLFASIEANRPGRDDVVYLERRGDEYDWRILPTDGAPKPVRMDRPEPDAWMSFSAPWPVEPERLRPFCLFFWDLLAELESMAAGADRCRWPVDEPWPHLH
jgi:hypothetical protein